jgi:hypothetical protein
MRKAIIGLLVALTWGLTVPAAPATAQVHPGTESEVELSVPPPAEGFTAAILADRTTGFDSGLAVLERAVSELNVLQPDLVLHIGDLVPGYIRDMEAWERDILRVKDILNRLEVPFFPLAGNHDVITGTGDPEDRRGEELYQRHFGPLYYSLDYANAHFVLLYTEETLQSEPRLSQAQRDWLAQDLAESEARHVFVLMHKPLWEYPEARWDEVHELLARHPVRAVFGGHFHHYYRSQKRDGIRYYVLGVTGGRTFAPELAGGLEHYCLLHVDEDGYRLALVKPGHVLPEDYVTGEDFHAMEKLRFLTSAETGIANPVQSPELGPVDEQVGVFIANPLDVALPVKVRGLARGGGWTFRPAERSFVLEPGGRRRIFLGISAQPLDGARLVAPEVEVEYLYVDGKGRSVPIALARRIPLRRRVEAPAVRTPLAVDGQADEPEWAAAPALTTAVWEAGPYETGQPGPAVRVLTSPAGVYFLAEAEDAHVSEFRGERILSDALFIGALTDLEDYDGDLSKPPVVVIFPFGPTPQPEAIGAFWDERHPVGAPAEGVHAAAERTAAGWRCEGFVPWDVLLSGDLAPDGDVLFNLGVWDNDGDLFTELHSWAPTDNAALWGRLRPADGEGP